MADLFDDARLKIARADKHIAELNAAIAALKDNYTASVEQSEAGHQSLIHACPELQDALRNLTLIIGDAIHNLRAALEFAWIATLEKQHIPYDPKHVSFPIRDTLQDVEGALNGIKLNTLSPKLYDQIVKGTQPCREGKGSVIWTIHNLDISDKHLLLLELEPMADISDIIVQKPDGEIVRGFGGAIRSPGPYIIAFESNIRIKEKGKLTVHILLKDADVFADLHVADLLSYFRKYTLYTLECLQNL